MATFMDLLALALRFENLKRFIEAQEVYLEDSDWEPTLDTDKHGLPMWGRRDDGETLTLFSACAEQLQKGNTSIKTHSCFREAQGYYLQHSGWKWRLCATTNDWIREDGTILDRTLACKEQLRVDMEALEGTTIAIPNAGLEPLR